MLEPADTYEQVYTGFRWQLPDRYNIAHSVCTRWAAERPDSIAIIEHMTEGPVRKTSFLQLEEMSNRFANLLKKSGIERGDRVALLLPPLAGTVLVASMFIVQLAADQRLLRHVSVTPWFLVFRQRLTFVVVSCLVSAVLFLLIA